MLSRQSLYSFALFLSTVTLPKITDLMPNDTSLPINFGQMFTYAWVYFFGNFFWGALVMVVGAGIYMRSQNAISAMAWFILAIAVWNMLMPMGLLYFIGLLCGISVGLLLYQLFVSKYG